MSTFNTSGKWLHHFHLIVKSRTRDLHIASTCDHTNRGYCTDVIKQCELRAIEYVNKFFNVRLFFAVDPETQKLFIFGYKDMKQVKVGENNA